MFFEGANQLLLVSKLNFVDRQLIIGHCSLMYINYGKELLKLIFCIMEVAYQFVDMDRTF